MAARTGMWRRAVEANWKVVVQTAATRCARKHGFAQLWRARARNFARVCARVKPGERRANVRDRWCSRTHTHTQNTLTRREDRRGMGWVADEERRHEERERRPPTVWVERVQWPFSPGLRSFSISLVSLGHESLGVHARYRAGSRDWSGPAKVFERRAVFRGFAARVSQRRLDFRPSIFLSSPRVFRVTEPFSRKRRDCYFRVRHVIHTIPAYMANRN